MEPVKMIELKLPTQAEVGEGENVISTGFNLEGTQMVIHSAVPGGLADRLQSIANIFGGALTEIEKEFERFPEAVRLIANGHPNPAALAALPRKERALFRQLKLVMGFAQRGMFGTEDFIMANLEAEDGLSEKHYSKDAGKWKELGTM